MISLYIPAYYFHDGIFTDEKLSILFSSFLMVLILIITQFLFVSILPKRLKISWLENFEKEIINFDLPAEEIRQKFKKDYNNLKTIDDFI
ncbi:hypothetical protein PA598K_07149 [Paenibacillus sp. 598K]|nr:hypothetical protein PA598K_07149 [Paenibacillus sp. 598K]